MTQFKRRIFSQHVCNNYIFDKFVKNHPFWWKVKFNPEPSQCHFLQNQIWKNNERQEELTALFQLRSEYRGNLKYTPSYYPVDLKCRSVGPFCSGAVEEISFQKMKFRCSHKNILMYKVYRHVSGVRYLSFCSGHKSVTFAYCKYQVLMLQCCSQKPVVVGAVNFF